MVYCRPAVPPPLLPEPFMKHITSRSQRSFNAHFRVPKYETLKENLEKLYRKSMTDLHERKVAMEAPTRARVEVRTRRSCLRVTPKRACSPQLI